MDFMASLIPPPLPPSLAGDESIAHAAIKLPPSYIMLSITDKMLGVALPRNFNCDGCDSIVILFLLSNY
jgi:hypothetical protein